MPSWVHRLARVVRTSKTSGQRQNRVTAAATATTTATRSAAAAVAATSDSRAADTAASSRRRPLAILLAERRTATSPRIVQFTATAATTTSAEYNVSRTQTKRTVLLLANNPRSLALLARAATIRPTRKTTRSASLSASLAIVQTATAQQRLDCMFRSWCIHDETCHVHTALSRTFAGG